MRRLLACIVLLILPSSIWADDRKPQDELASLSLDATVARVPGLVAAGKTNDLKTLADRDIPDPWLVVEKLCLAGEVDAARAFASSSPRAYTKALPAYVDARATITVEDGMWKLFDELRVQQPRTALHRFPQPGPPLSTVIGILLRSHEATVQRQLSNTHAALRLFKESGRAAARIGWHHRAGLQLMFAAVSEQDLGRIPQSVAFANEALEHWLAIEFDFGVMTGLLQLADLAEKEHRTVDAQGYMERVLKRAHEAGDDKTAAEVMHRLGMLCAATGQHRKALEYYHRCLPLYRKLNMPIPWSGVQVNIGIVHSSLGNYPKAIEYYRTGIDTAVKIRHGEYEGNGLLNLAGVYWRIGDFPRALDFTDRALRKLADTGRQGGVVRAQIGLGILSRDMGDLDRAVQLFQSALTQSALLKMDDVKRSIVANLARTHLLMGKLAEARRGYEEAVTLAEAAADPVDACISRASLGEIDVLEKKYDTGIKTLEKTAREARRLHLRSQVVRSRELLVQAYLLQDKPERAMFTALQAMEDVENLVTGLDMKDASTARGTYANLFSAGALAAVRAGETENALTFLENGRAGALLELLGGRSVLRWQDVSPALRKAELAAKQVEARARAAYQEAARSGKMDDARIAAGALGEAQDRVADVMERIFEELRQDEDDLLSSRAAPQEEIQDLLQPGDALVVYGLGKLASVACVLTKTTAEVVELAPAETLADAVPGGLADDPAESVEAGVATLRKLLVEPLPLPKKIRRVLVSPEGCLTQVPFGLLFDVPVGSTPSGTTHVFLHTRPRSAGSGVLALGDPVYVEPKKGDAASEVYARTTRGARTTLLPRLPMSGMEAKAVGTKLLLREAANEGALRAALERKTRWRSIHFACHGLIDQDRPLLSALALSADPKNDGFLTVLEILRMEIPADLAVLSACETARGKVIWGEGVIGLTRAFMFAGTPRVLCSLWKVDDAATAALMKRFYELWHPGGKQAGLPAAEALRKAQEHVRAQKDWSHPYYWAGWVLYGLPD